MNRKQKIQFLQLTLVMIVGAFIELLGVSVLLPIVNMMMDSTAIKTNPMLSELYRLLGSKDISIFYAELFAILLFIYIVRGGYNVFKINFRAKYTTESQYQISVRLLNSYLMKPYIYNTQINTAEILNSILTNVNMFFTLISSGVDLLMNVAVCICVMIFVMVQDCYATLFISCILLALIYFVVVKPKKVLEEFGKKNISSSRNKSQCILEIFSGIKEIKLHHNEKFFEKKFEAFARTNADVFQKYQLLSGRTVPLIEMFTMAVLLAYIIIYLLVSGDVSGAASKIAVYAVAAYKLIPCAGTIASGINIIIFNNPSIDTLYDDIRRTEKFDLQERNVCQNYDEQVELHEKIKLEMVSYKYPSGASNIIDSVNLLINANESTAFIGASGAGKTTLIDVIIGLLEPTKGRILADGREIDQNMRIWQNSIGYVPQNIYLMDDTIRRNVAWGVPDNEIDDEKVWIALRRAQIEQFVIKQEEQLELRVGERGERLSGGQRQRIGIARALYRNPQILVFDEATSALDNETEKAVMDSINNLHGELTILIIAHRLSTIKDCDHVYEVGGGKVVEVYNVDE